MCLSKMRLLRPAAAMVVAILGVTLFTAAPAQAATCYGSSCYAKDPYATKCFADGAVTLDSQFNNASAYGDNTIYLEYSYACNAFWAIYNNVSFGGFSVHYGVNEYSSSGVYIQHIGKTVNSNTYTNSSMIPWTSGRLYRACWHPLPEGNGNYCTDYFK
jgi:hypothetical protein